MSFRRENTILKATYVLSSDFHTSLDHAADEEDPKEVKRKFIDNIGGLVDSLRAKFQVDSQKKDVTNRIHKLVRQDAEKEVFIPLENACKAIASYFQAEYETDFDQFYSLTDADFIIVLIRRVRAIRISLELVNRTSRRSYESTRLAKDYASVFAQALNTKLRTDHRSYLFSKLSEFNNLSDPDFFALILEVTRVMAGGEVQAESDDQRKDIQFMITTIAAALACAHEPSGTLHNERFTPVDLEELSIFIKIGESLAARLKIILFTTYKLSVKPKLSPKQEQTLVNFASLLFNMHQNESLSLNSQNLLLLGISKYGDLWKVLRILQRAQQLQPDLQSYSLEAISESILENVDNEAILSADLSIVGALQAQPLEDSDKLPTSDDQQEVLDVLRPVFHQSKSQLEFDEDVLQPFELLRLYGIERIQARKDGQLLELSIDFQDTSVKIFIYIKTNSIDWDRLYPLNMSSVQEQKVVLQITKIVTQLMKESATTKNVIKLDTPTPAAIKGPKRQYNAQSNALEFSTPLNQVEPQEDNFKESAEKLNIKVVNLSEIDTIFPKRMPEYAKRIIKAKLRRPIPKFLQKLEYLVEGKTAYRYAIQSFRVILIHSETSAENSFELEAYAVGHRKEIYTNFS